MKTDAIKIHTTVNAPREQVWKYWTEPEHIKNWNYASEDWHTPAVENDVRENGKFSWRMEAKDGSSGFDFVGIYTKIKKPENIKYTMDDGRKAELWFKEDGDATLVEETFEAEKENSRELQKNGWQAILNNFKKYVESIS